MPEISVIVPVYNTEKYLRRCIDSILAQTFTDFELILVDDGSTDNSGKICDEYAQADKRVRVFHNENGGVSSARNFGLDVAQGKYIMFSDSDDYVEPNWCELLHDKIVCNQNCFIVANFYDVNSQNNRSPHIYKFDLEQLDYYNINKIGLCGSLWNKIYKKDTIAKNKISFKKDAYMGEDVGFNVEYFKQCEKIIYIHQPLYNYVNRSNSAVHQYRTNYFEELLYPFYVRKDLIDKKYLGEYCDSWLYTFINHFSTVFDKRCTWSFTKKFMYNQKMLSSKEFQFCLNNATGQKENPLALKILKTKCYLLYYLFIKAVKVKNVVFNKGEIK